MSADLQCELPPMGKGSFKNEKRKKVSWVSWWKQQQISTTSKKENTPIKNKSINHAHKKETQGWVSWWYENINWHQLFQKEKVPIKKQKHAQNIKRTN